MASSPTQRTLAWCRDQGWLAQVVEYWNPHTKTRRDLYGFIDIVCLDPTNHAIIGIQATSTGNQSARVRKIQGECAEQARLWLTCHGKLLVIGWRKYAKKVDRRSWRETVTELSLKDLA